MTSSKKEATAMEDLRDAYLLCRTIGHAWFQQSATDLPKPERGTWYFVLGCERCACRRVDTISRKHGDVESRKYEYPDGYEINETVVRSALRIEWEQRLLAQRKAS